MWWHELGEVENEYTSYNFSLFAIFVPKITTVGGNLTKFWRKQFWLFFLRHGVDRWRLAFIEFRQQDICKLFWYSLCIAHTVTAYIRWLRISVSSSCSEVFVHLSKLSDDFFNNVVFLGAAWSCSWRRLTFTFDERHTAVLDAAARGQSHLTHLDNTPFSDVTIHCADCAHDTHVTHVCFHVSHKATVRLVYLVHESPPDFRLLDAVSNIDVDVVGVCDLACSPRHDIHVDHGIDEQQQESCTHIYNTATRLQASCSVGYDTFKLILIPCRKKVSYNFIHVSSISIMIIMILIHISNYWYLILCWYFMWTEHDMRVTENTEYYHKSTIRSYMPYRLQFIQQISKN